MSHEMTEHDSAVYFSNPAWHGLGTVCEDEMDTTSALIKSELAWAVYKTSAIFAGGVTSDAYNAVIRSDTEEILGVVTPNYKCVQNREVFQLADAFGNDVTVESAGSIQGGRKVYLLLHGDSFDAGREDEVHRYMALFWGHDGKVSLTCLPTSVRVVCKNTLDMVIGQAEGTRNKISIKHAGDIDEKMESAREAIARFKEVGTFYEETVKGLARTNPDTSDINKFFWNVYELLHNERIPVNPSTDVEERVRFKAFTTISDWMDNFEAEGPVFGHNYWVAANAITNHIQHRAGARGRKRTPSSAAYNNLIGKNATDSVKVMRTALEMV
jgi:phage/plasmid-like protein (TIGR03299 family)